MHWLVLIVFALHGIAHLVGFTVSFKLIQSEELPYSTTILMGQVDLGDVGIRWMGVLWLLTALAFVGAGLAAATLRPYWLPMAYAVVSLSLVLCVLGLPQARVGLVLNGIILIGLVLGSSMAWLPQS